MKDRDYSEIDDLEFCDDNGDEWMKVEEHEDILENFKENAQIFFKELIVAMKKKDDEKISEAMDELAEHLGVTR